MPLKQQANCSCISLFWTKGSRHTTVILLNFCPKSSSEIYLVLGAQSNILFRADELLWDIWDSSSILAKPFFTCLFSELWEWTARAVTRSMGTWKGLLSSFQNICWAFLLCQWSCLHTVRLIQRSRRRQAPTSQRFDLISVVKLIQTVARDIDRGKIYPLNTTTESKRSSDHSRNKWHEIFWSSQLCSPPPPHLFSIPFPCSIWYREHGEALGSSRLMWCVRSKSKKRTLEYCNTANSLQRPPEIQSALHNWSGTVCGRWRQARVAAGINLYFIIWTQGHRTDWDTSFYFKAQSSEFIEGHLPVKHPILFETKHTDMF